MPFEFERLTIADVILITPKIFGDDRGYFLETYKSSDFAVNGITELFVQDNYSKSSKGVIRGLHYQKNPMAQGKLVKCISGVIFDVAVDIRNGSATYGKWVGELLDDKEQKMLYTPPGFAHGFSVLSDTARIMYKVTKLYSLEHERGIIWNDPDIAVDWRVNTPSLSSKDLILPGLKDCDNNSLS